MMMIHTLRWLAQFLTISSALLVPPRMAMLSLKSSSTIHRPTNRYHSSNNHVLAMMTAVEKPPALKVTNALDSPSIIQNSKDFGKIVNAFSSPSCRINGGTTGQSINPKDSPSCLLLNRAGTETFDAMTSPSVKFLGIDKDKVKNAMTSPSLQITSESKTKLDMPLSLIVGQETIKTALILLAVNPNVGGVVITGGKGTGKSAMARALHRVMPPIEVIKGSPYNIAPDAKPNEMDDFLKKDLVRNNQQLGDLEAEVVTCPFIQVPVNVMEDRLFGSVDVKKTLETGDTIFTPGLLAAAHRGILYVDDINLLDTDLVTMLLQAITDGFVIVEREGESPTHLCIQHHHHQTFIVIIIIIITIYYSSSSSSSRLQGYP